MLRTLRQPALLIVDTGYDLKLSGAVGIFVLLFLGIFQPFGLSRVWPELKYYLIVGYSATCFVVLFLNFHFIPKLLPRVFDEQRWTVLKRMIWQLWLVFAVGTGNFLFACCFNLFYDFYQLDLDFFLYLQLITLLIAIIPIVVVNLLRQNYELRKNLQASQEITARLETIAARDEMPRDKASRDIVLTAENEKDRFMIPADSFLFAQSEGNYTRVFAQENSAESLFIRSSLSRIEKQLADFPHLVRCHRAYIVNIKKVKKVTGNALGLSLELESTDKPVPVARSYVRQFKQRMGMS
ncbi:MAG: LytTR family transcriptional regulator DNA-binding domain-containing protein [Candidatus Zixiibacteriota bacterium]|nr:MAG: LytTR family transcriptional regulator DNA-binding domain-containing protein [candidate division Zixibacteria bacterium]